MMVAAERPVGDSLDSDLDKTVYIEASDAPVSKGPKSTLKMLASVHIIAVLLLVVIVLLTTGRKGTAQSGRLVSGSKQGKGCPNVSAFAGVSVQTTPPERETTTEPWCDDEEEPPCRTRTETETTATATVTATATTKAASTTQPTTSDGTMETTTESTRDWRPTHPTSITLKTRFPPSSRTNATGRSTTATTTTRMPLVCTLGSGGTAFIAFPTPGLCSHVLYTHVLVSDGTLRDWQGGNGWRDFVNALTDEEFTDYPGGVSFDVRQPNAVVSLDIPSVKKELRELVQKNIKHYGILNIITRSAYLYNLVAVAGAMIMRLRQLQGGDRSRHIILAAGLSAYVEPTAWATYKAQFRVLAGLDVDILITISSVNTIELETSCFAAPPTAWKTVNASYPGLDKHVTLLLASQQYQRQELYVGLSFEMGVMLYQLKNTSTPRDRTPYAPCTQFTLVGYAQVCDPKASLSRIDYLPTEFGAISSFDFFYDSWETMKRKVDSVMKLPVRRKIAWMLFDTHLSDITWNCTAPRDREKRLKEYLGTFG